jgi:hypothetical protein
MLTLLCIAVVCGSILAVGLPVCWLLNSRARLSGSAWIEVPFFGIAAIVLVLQNLVYLNVPVGRSTWPFWIVVAVLWVWMISSGTLVSSLRAFPLQAFSVAVTAYVLQGLGLLILGARHYVGRAWGDQFNYTAMAQFLTDWQFSTTLADVGHQPYLAVGVHFKFERIGQSVLHGFFTTTAFGDAKLLFEPTILLTPFLIVLAVFALCQRYHLPPRTALATGFCAAVLPAISLVHLEGFLSQALAIPLLLLAPVLLDDVAESRRLPRFIATAIFLSATASIYSEFLVILIAIAAVALMMPRARPRWPTRLLLLIGLVLSIFALNVRFIDGLFTSFGRVDLPVLSHIYPWALTVDGILRVWLGDLGAAATGLTRGLLRTVALGLTALGYYGLLRAAILRLTNAHPTSHAAPTNGRAFPWMTLAVAVLPAIVFARDDQHPYQFYKLLLTTAPLLTVGVALALTRLGALTFRAEAGDPPRHAWASRAAMIAVWAAMLAGVTAGSVGMAVDSARAESGSRSNAHYLLDPDVRRLEFYLTSLRGQRLVISVSDDTWNHGLLNAWVAYFARHNAIWLANPSLNDADMRRWPELRDVVTPDHFPPDVLLLTNADTPAPASVSATSTKVWSAGKYELWRPAGSWVYPIRVENPNGLDGVLIKPTYWLGGGVTRFRLLASRGGEVQTIAQTSSGPNLDGPARRVRVSSSTGFERIVDVVDGLNVFSFEVRAGLNEVQFEPLEQPPPRVLGQDGRPLVIGLHDPRFTLEHEWAFLSGVVNQNGLEQLDDQPFFWMGRGPTVLDLVSGRNGFVRLVAEALPGPSIPNDVLRRVRVTTDDGHSETIVTRGGPLSLVVPIGEGRRRVTLLALDPPRVVISRDPRPLILGLKGLSVSIVSGEVPAAERPRSR